MLMRTNNIRANKHIPTTRTAASSQITRTRTDHNIFKRTTYLPCSFVTNYYIIGICYVAHTSGHCAVAKCCCPCCLAGPISSQSTHDDCFTYTVCLTTVGHRNDTLTYKDRIRTPTNHCASCISPYNHRRSERGSGNWRGSITQVNASLSAYIAISRTCSSSNYSMCKVTATRRMRLTSCRKTN